MRKNLLPVKQRTSGSNIYFMNVSNELGVQESNQIVLEFWEQGLITWSNSLFIADFLRNALWLCRRKWKCWGRENPVSNTCRSDCKSSQHSGLTPFIVNTLTCHGTLTLWSISWSFIIQVSKFYDLFDGPNQFMMAIISFTNSKLIQAQYILASLLE